MKRDIAIVVGFIVIGIGVMFSIIPEPHFDDYLFVTAVGGFWGCLTAISIRHLP